MKPPPPVTVLVALAGLLLTGAGIYDILAPKAYVYRLAKYGTPPWEVTHRLVAVGNVARRYPPLAYNDATEQEAGRAFHTLMRWEGDEAWSPLIVHLPPGARGETGILPDSNPLHLPPRRWYKELIPQAAEGLSSDQLRFLRRVAANPDYTHFRIFAGARDSDILGSRYTFAQPQRDLIFFLTMPIGRLTWVERAFQTAFARAALELSEKRPKAAEATLREAANGGVLMMNNGLVIDAMAGATWTKMSLLALADLYEVSGRSTEAATIRRDVQAPTVLPLPASLTRKGVDLVDIREVLPSIAARKDIAPGLKWEYLISVQALNVPAFCVREWKFDENYETWRADLRRHMVRRDSDARFFDWITDPPRSRENCPGKGNGKTEQTDPLRRG
jgi:hypothetical protein